MDESHAHLEDLDKYQLSVAQSHKPKIVNRSDAHISHAREAKYKKAAARAKQDKDNLKRDTKVLVNTAVATIPGMANLLGRPRTQIGRQKKNLTADGLKVACRAAFLKGTQRFAIGVKWDRLLRAMSKLVSLRQVRGMKKLRERFAHAKRSASAPPLRCYVSILFNVFLSVLQQILPSPN